jgi:hypothetical protein
LAARSTPVAAGMKASQVWIVRQRSEAEVAGGVDDPVVKVKVFPYVLHRGSIDATRWWVQRERTVTARATQATVNPANTVMFSPR